MTTEEHLQKIKAKCECLLAIAEKRREYPYAWEAHGSDVAFWWGDECHSGYWLKSPQLDQSTAAFIASCAGNAEAGWRATIEIVEILLPWRPWATGLGGNLAKQIIAIWPEELL